MNLMLWLYLVDVADSLKSISAGLIIGSLLVLFLLGIMWVITNEYNSKDEQTKYKQYAGYLLLMLGIGSAVFTIIPSNKTLYLMMGTEVTKEIVNNPAVQRIGARVMDIVDEKLNELSPPKKEKSNETK